MTSSIAWLKRPDGGQGRSWNPTTGCTPDDPSCLHCYAAAVAGREMCEDHVGLTTKKKRRNAAGKLVMLPVFNGTIHLHLDRVRDPLRWRKPDRVFVDSMSDLFHKEVPFHFIDSVFAVMLITSMHDIFGGHTYLLLTKRAEIARAYLTGSDLPQRLAREAGQMMEDGDAWHDAYNYVREHGPTHEKIQLGISAGTQAGLDRRLPHLLKCPATVRWLSLEPMIEGLDLRLTPEMASGLSWVVPGGESGPGARPCETDWIRSILRQCAEHGLAAFPKQLGARPMRSTTTDEAWPPNTIFDTATGHENTPWRGRWARLVDAKGEKPDEWPEDLRPRAYPT